MTQRALKKKSGSVRPFQQSYTVVGLEDSAWDTCTYTFGSQENLTAIGHHHPDNLRRPAPPPPVAKPNVTYSKSRSTDPQQRSSSLSSSSTKSGGSNNGRGGGIFSLFKLKKNNKQDTSVDTRVIVTSPAVNKAGVTNNACSPVVTSTKPPVLHLKKTKVRNVSGETEDHFAIVPADGLRREETKNVSSVCSRGWESPSIHKARERLSQLENPVYEKVNGSPNNELYCRDVFDKQPLTTQSGGGGHSIHLQKRANRYVLSEGEEVQNEEDDDSQEVEEDDSGKGASLVNSTSVSDESSALNSLDISGYIEWEDEVAHLAGGGAINSNGMEVKRRSIAGPYDMSREYPPNGMQFSTMPHRLYHAPHLVPYSRQSAVYDSPNITHKRKVLKPSSEFILMGPYESASSTVSDDRASSIYSSTMSLAKTRGKFSSMPSLNVLDKESKKMKKLLDKEKKKAEKMEKKKEKLEKKERKRFEKEMRKSGQTLPRNWEYVNKPIEIVYERPRTDWKLTAVPISLDEPIYQVPKKNGIHPKMVHYASTPDLLRVAEVYGSQEFLTEEIDEVEDESDYAPRAVVLRKGPNGFGFVLRGAKCDSPGFRHPPNDAPAMQYLDTVDKGSVADKAGLKGGDFILEINGRNVTRASHEYVVNLIKTSGTSLTMNVLTVKPTERDQNWYVHQDGSMTLPHRRRQAPEPPRRDPKTSLSFSKAKSKSFAEGMAEIEKLDQALAEYDVSDTPSGESVYGSGHKSNGAEMKTASIRAGYAKKRVSSVELENLCRSNSPHKPEHLSPSEVRIKKYHKKQSNLEKSQSTPNLAQNPEELDTIPMVNSNQPMYRTVESSGPSDYSPYSSCSSGPSKYTHRLHPVPYMTNTTNTPPGMDVSGCRHSVAIGSNVQVNSMPSRGKGRNVGPPIVNAGGKPPAPAPPPQVVKISTNKEQPVYASVVNGTVHQTKQPPKENPYESSFRPGTVAMFGNKTPVVTPSALSQVKLRNSKQNDGQTEKPPQNAMLVTADVHATSELKNKQKRNSSYYEPEPDYDSEHEGDVNKQSRVVNGNSSHKTVISINNNTAPQATNGYTIPQPPPTGPNNPVYSIPQQINSYSGPSFLPPPDQISLGVGTPINMMPAQSPSSSSSGSYKSAIETKAPTPPPPPPPAPAPPLSSDINSQLIPPPPQFCPPPPPTAFAKTIVSDNPNEFLDEIKRAAKERMTRSHDVDAKDKDLEHSSKSAAPMDKTQAAILQAVAKRRSMLEHSDKDNVVNQIEAQIQKTKKLQSAKYYNSGNGVKKEIETLSENKELCRERSSPSPPIPASKPLKQAAPAAVHSTKPIAPAKPKTVLEKVQNKPPAITVTTNAPAKEAKTKLPSNTLPESKNATAEKMAPVETQKSKELVRTIATSVKVSDKTKVDAKTKSKDDGTESGEEDFLKKAEKARQMYLQRRSGVANDKSVTNNLPTTPVVSTSPANTTTSPPTTKKTAPVAKTSTKTTVTVNGEAKKPEPKPLTNKTVQKTNKANIEHTKKAAAPVAKPQLSNGNVKPNRMHIEVQSASNQKDADKVGNVSIKDRIASLQKQNGQQNSSPNPVKLITLKGVTTSHSHTDPFSSSDSCSTPNDSPYHEINIVAPPPGFGDNDQSSSSGESYNSLPRVHILPAPLSELSISTVPPYGHMSTDNLVPQDDSLSLISSLSTLSTLSTSSTEHQIEIVPPPPSGFEDKASPVSTDQGFEESFIPPPPQFDAYMKNAASTKNSFRNKPVENWFYVDVLDWLESVQMHQYKINFANHCVDGKKLLNLKRNDYITLGVTQVGHRMNLERSIKKLAMATQQKIPQ